MVNSEFHIPTWLDVLEGEFEAWLRNLKSK